MEANGVSSAKAKVWQHDWSPQSRMSTPVSHVTIPSVDSIVDEFILRSTFYFFPLGTKAWQLPYPNDTSVFSPQLPQMPSKYDPQLGELIRSMLCKRPEERPDVKLILRQPYIKRQIAMFLEATKE